MHASSIRIYAVDLKDIILEVAKSYQQRVKEKEALQQGNIHPKFKYYALKGDGILT
jgi:hypothetical protein